MKRNEESKLQTRDSSLSTKAQNDTKDDEIMLKVLDKELNSLVFALYDLSVDEIALIENT